MRQRPEGETRKERRYQRVIATGVVVVFLLLGTIVFQNNALHDSQQTTNTVLMEHTNTLNETAALQRQVDKVISGLPAADKELTAFAKQLLAVAQYAITCLTTKNCANPPPVSPTP